jgi:hydrogenase expression/formation protein HypE
VAAFQNNQQGYRDVGNLTFLDMIEMGKLATEELKKLLRCIEKHPKVIIPPAPGFDSGVQMINENECLVVSTDPCIGVPEKWFGWLLIHYAASDVALFGAKPEFCTITLLGPPSTKADTFIKIMEQVCAVADELNMTVVTGHTGTYDGLSTLVGTCTAYGTVSKNRLITPGGAQAGDYIICTKQIGIETAVNFTLTHRALAENLFDAVRTRMLQNLVNMQTCVNEASLLAEIGGVHAMHDTTEGGLVAALNEMAESSNLGFTLDLEKLPILEEALILQRDFGLSQSELLSISSTGTLLAAIDPKKKDEALQELQKHGIEASCIGTFTKNKKRLIQHGKNKTAFPKTAEDPYAKIMLK